MSLIDNFFSRIIAFCSVLFQWVVALGQDKKIIGVEAEVRWVNMFDYSHFIENDQSVYCSLSKEPPYEGLFDDYGIPDDEIFHYFSSVKDVLKHCASTHDEGWRIHACRLVSAKEDLTD